MLGGEGLQGHFEKQIATWWRNWFSPPRKWLHDASFDCMLSKCLTEIISAIPRVTLSFSPGQLCLGSDFVHVKVSSGRILRGERFLCSIQILNHSLRHSPTLKKSKLVSFLHNYEWTKQERISTDTISLLKPLLPFHCSLA